MKFTCKQCGHCCLNLRDAFCTCATEEDVKLWEEHGREDILAWVDPLSFGDEIFAYDIWISPTTGEDVARCPWLRKLPGKEKYICRIQDMKPEHCRQYPLSREHAEETGCPGFGGTVKKKRKQGNEMPKAVAGPYKTRIETFFRKVDVTVKKDRAGFSIFYGLRKIPTARLRFTGEKDTVEVLWWSHRDKWESIGDVGGIFLSFDDALKYVEEDPLGCLWLCPF